MEFDTKIVSAISGFNWGYSLTNLPVQIIEKYAEITKLEEVTAAMLSTLEVALCVGSAVGCMMTPLYAGKLGLTNSLRILFVLFIIVNIATMVPVHWIYLTGIRFMAGFMTSSISSLTPLLVAEVLDPHAREKTMMMFAICLNSGVLVAYLVHLAISFQYTFWFLSFALPIIYSLVALFCLWRVNKLYRLKRMEHTKGHGDNLMTNDSTSTLSQPDGDMIPESSAQFIATTAEETSNTFQKRMETAPESSFNQKLTRSQFIRIAYVTVSLGMMQMFTGVDAIVVYASEIFGSLFTSSRAGIFGSLILGVFNLSYTFIAAPFAERQPRRIMLMIGVIGVGVFHFVIAVLYFIKAPTVYVLISLMLLFLSYNIGPEPIVFMFFSEMFPEKYKIQLNGLGYTVNWISSIISVFIFDFFVGGNEQYVYMFFGTMTLILGISGTLLAPETFHKSLAEIELQIRAWTKKERHQKDAVPKVALKMSTVASPTSHLTQQSEGLLE
ncbi:Hexose_transporter [Hexamita inflata]|uniref:Hexose transporter n=1 Tax=Hexamita inflata TaxID=28002 RepID=A0AA86QXS5_9EUKA|nr:Hexose transporter [Hexamita inflata]